MNIAVDTAANLLPGFHDPVHDAQSCFRAMLNAMARPGSIHTMRAPAGIPAGWSPALTALALCLFDQDTPVWLDSAAATPEASAHLRFHCGCPLTDQPGQAAFAVIADAAPPLHSFAIGDPQYPEQSATLILSLASLTDGPPLRWQGPGIKDTQTVSPKGLPADFLAGWVDNHALYPSGFDVILTAGAEVMALPRGVSVEEA